MEITKSDQGGVATVAINGRLDAVSAVDAEKEFSSLLEEGKDKMLIDLAGLDYISSAGLRVLLVVAKRIQQTGGKVALSNLADNVKEVFEISGFSSIFKIYDSNDEAAEFLQG